MPLVSLVFLGAFAMQALAEESPQDPDQARRAKVFATVGNETITVGEIEDILNARSPYARRRYAEPQVLKDFADNHAKSALFYQGAAKLGYADDPQVVEFADQTLVRLFVRREFEEKATPEDVPEEDVLRYYQEHSDDFRQPEMRRARHILVATREEAANTLKLLKNKTTTFGALAKTKSLDTETKLRGGDLLYFTEDGRLVGKEDEAIDETLAKAAFDLEKVGDLSKPLDLGDDKWSVLELTGIRPERVRTLQQASPWIRRRISRDQREAALERLITELRTELKPETYPERLDAIVLEPSSEPINPPNQ